MECKLFIRVFHELRKSHYVCPTHGFFFPSPNTIQEIKKTVVSQFSLIFPRHRRSITAPLFLPDTLSPSQVNITGQLGRNGILTKGFYLPIKMYSRMMAFPHPFVAQAQFL